MNSRLLLFLLIQAAFGSSGASRAQANDTVRATIAAPGERIVQNTAGRRVLLFGEEPETIHFTGRMRSLAPARARYYWTFAGGEPARYPAHGVSARLQPGSVKYAGPGEACLHVVDRNGRALIKAKLAIGHISFVYQAQPGGDPAEPVYNYIPEGARPGRHDELFVRANVVVQTDPPLPGVDLGRLTFDHPRGDRIAPDRVITDAQGAFATTLAGWVGSEKHPVWPALSLELVQYTRDRELLARLSRQNEAIRHRDDPREAPLTATPVELYQVGMSDAHRGQVEVNDGFQLGFPDWLSSHRFSESSSDERSMHVSLDDVRRDGPAPIVHCTYPPAVTEKLRLQAEDRGREDNPRLAEDGRYYLRVHGTPRVIYRVEEGEFLEAVTLRPRGGRLAVLLHRPASGGFFIAQLNAQTGQIGFSFPLREIGCEHLTWISDRYLLGTWYGRRGSSYTLVDLQKQRVVASGNGEGEYEMQGNRLVAKTGAGALRVLFTVPK